MTQQVKVVFAENEEVTKMLRHGEGTGLTNLVWNSFFEEMEFN